jgi:DNA polymerase III epsilon subunit-like protein
MALWSFRTEPDPKNRPANYKLATLCKWFGIEVGEGAHDALYDCRLVAQLLQRLHPPGATTQMRLGLDD